MKRDSSIDITKGVLIIFLLISHVAWIVKDWDQLLTNDIINNVDVYEEMLWGSYYMTTFFFITGMCSNFDKSPIVFFTSQFRTLLLPNILFSLIHCIQFYGMHDYIRSVVLYGGSLWFLTALFLAKNMLYVMKRIISSPAILGGGICLVFYYCNSIGSISYL